MNIETHYAHKSVGGKLFTITLFVDGETTTELVGIDTEMGTKIIHESDFPTSLLGSASRDEYARVTLSSIADKYLRNPAFYNPVRVR